MELRCEAGPTNPTSTTMLEYSQCMSDGEITAADRCTLCKLLCKITRCNEGNKGDTALSRRENSSGGSQRSDSTSARVSKAECLPKREKEDKGPQKLKTSPKRNIMEWLQIKSGRAELPMKIFIIPRTFGYRGFWN